MIHRVEIENYSEDGTLRFSLDGETIVARHQIPKEDWEEALTFGTTIPIRLTLRAEDEAEYSTATSSNFESTDSSDESLRYRAVGRVQDYLDSDVVRLDGVIGIAVKLAAPQLSTDYRRGSMIDVIGVLEAALPEPDHEH